MGTRERVVKSRSGLGIFLLLIFTAGVLAGRPAYSQEPTGDHAKKGRSAGGEMASGTGDIGKGAAKGAGNLAAGAGKGAVDLVTLHPIDAAALVGKGGASAGKNIAVGTVKGTGKIVTGVGKGIKHIF